MKKINFNKTSRLLKLVLIVCCISISNFAFAQPANDNPCNAQLITANAGCVPTPGSNVGANNSTGGAIPDPGCGTFAGSTCPDVWYQVVVPASGAINITTQAGSFTDTQIALYTGTCGAMTLVACNDDFAGLTSYISSPPLTVGSTVWIDVAGFGSQTGTFSLCVTAAAPPPPPCNPGNSCLTPNCIATNPTNTMCSGVASLGSGGIYGCLGSSPNPIWNVFQATITGPITMGANSTGSAGGNPDIDYVMWGPFGSPAAGCAGISAANILSCSYSTAGLNSWTFNAIAGQTYILLTTNYSQTTGTTVNWPVSPAGSISCSGSCTATAGSNSPVCAGSPLNLTCNAVAGATLYHWTGPNGFNVNGQNQSIASPTVAAAGVYTVTVTAGATTCVGTVTVVVNPLPAVSPVPPTLTICSGGSTNNYIPPVTPFAGSSYSWTATANPAGSVTGFPASGTGPIAYTLTASGIVSGTVTFVITPIGTPPTSCHGPAVNYVVTVDPPPTITNPPTQQFICSGSSSVYNPTANLATATFNWTASSANGVTGFTAAGTGNINEVLTNNGTTAGSVIYVITPVGAPPSNCFGTPVNLIVNVYPTPSIASAGPNQNVCGTTATLAGNIPTVGVGTWTSISGGGVVTNISLNNSGVTGLGAGANVFEWVITNAPCPPSTSTVTITQDPIPTITNPLLTQTICSASLATFIPTSSVVGATFDWTASLTSGTITGFSAAGTGNISEALTNSGTTSGTVTYVVTPTGPGPSFCPGTPSNFVVTIDPIPTMTNVVLAQSLCSGGIASFFPVADVLGSTFAWAASASAGTITGFSAIGAGNINEAITNTGATQGTVTYTITPTGPPASSCFGSPINFVVTVDPAPSVTNSPLTMDICSGINAVINPTSNVVGATFAWTSSSSAGTTTGNTAIGAGNINDLLTNTGTTSGIVTYAITASSPALGCAGTPVNFDVTVDPIPTITNPLLTQEICANSAALFNPISNVVGTTYGWTATSSSANITGFSAIGSGNINEVLANSGTTSETVTYVITPTGPATSLCNGPFVNFVVTIDPLPVITNAVLAQTLCSGGNATFNPTSNTVGATFNWTAIGSSANVTGYSAIGTGSINDIVSNSGSATETITYTVIPTGAGPLFCQGPSVNFVVSVDPTPVISNPTLTQEICSNGTASFSPTSNVAGSTFAWTVVGSSANVTGFSAGNGNLISQIITNSGNVTETVTYSVTPTGPAASFCPGTPSDFVVTIDPVSTITNAVLTQSICSGDTAIFSPVSNVLNSSYNWTASASAGTITGFSAIGTGNISEIITNTGNTQGTVIYTITPSGPGPLFCTGQFINFTVNVDPTPTVTNNPLTQTFCSGGTAVLGITSNVAGTTFAYAAASSSGNVTGYTVAGAGNINDVLTNTGTTTETVTYVITPTGPGAAACPGTVANYVVTVDPTPTVTNATLAQTICSGDVATFTPTSSVPLTTFNWTATATAGTITGFTPIGTGPINDIITNTGAATGTVTYVITPVGNTANACSGPIVNFVVTVNPIPAVTNAVLTQSFCSGGTAAFIPTSNVTGTTFNWAAVASAGTVTGFTLAGTGNISDVVTNTGANPETVTYAVTPVGPGFVCPVNPVNFVVTVNPTPTVTNATLAQTMCSGSTATFTPTSIVTGTTFAWTATASSPSITGFSANGVGNITDAIANSGAPGTVTYIVTPTSPPPASCVGDTVHFTVTINSIPVPVVSNNGPVCVGSQLDLSANTFVGGVYAWTGPNGFVSALEDPTVNVAANTLMSGTYYINISVLGCSRGDSTTVIVNPIPTATVTGGSSVCFGTIAASVNIALTGNAPWNITYSDGTTSTTVTTSASPYVILAPGTGTYTVSSVADANCQGTATGTAIVVINPIPVAGVTPDMVTGCAPLCVTFTNTSTITSGNIAAWAWDFGDGGIDNTQSPSAHCYTQAGSYTVTLQVASAAGCTATSVYTNLIAVTAYPVANFECPASASIYTPTIQFNDMSTGATSWHWDFGDTYIMSTDTSNERNPSHSFSHVGSYCVLLTVGNAGMCYDSMQVCVDITPEFTCFIPNAFSPNHDGINDEFYCKATNVLTFEMTIYDRWGNKIFFTDDLLHYWNGDVNEDKRVSQEDVYVYIIHIKDINKEKHDYIGNVTLVR